MATAGAAYAQEGLEIEGDEEIGEAGDEEQAGEPSDES